MAEMTKERSTDSSSAELLARLRSRGRSEAWQEFLAIYSPLIMHIVGQYEHHRDSRDDCYLFICEKLSAKDFSRLLSYSPEGPASFRSWLNVVIVNLCIDWSRHRQGRLRPYKSIRKLSLFDQLVFKYRFQQRVGLQTCLVSMQAEFPDLTEFQLAGAVTRINKALTPKQQWLLSTRHAQTVSLDGLKIGSEICEPVESGHDPEQATARGQQHDKLQQALVKLTPHHRLLIKLRYQQDLSLREVARLTRLGDPFRARRHIQTALAELAKHLGF